LQSPYGAFCLRQKVAVDLIVTRHKARCNPLTGLFVCDKARDRRKASLALPVAIPLRGFLFATSETQDLLDFVAAPTGCNPLTGLFVCDPWEPIQSLSFALEAGCNPLTGLFVCDGGQMTRVIAHETWLQSPYGAFCLRLHSPWAVQRRRDHEKLQSPYGAFCLRRVSTDFFSSETPHMLQSPYGAFCLRRGAIQRGESRLLTQLQSPYGAFCLRPIQAIGDGREGDIRLQSPYGAFCLRRKGGVAAPWCLELWLQSPYGAFCLRHRRARGERRWHPGRVAIPLRGFLFATQKFGAQITCPTSKVLQSPYGAFCLRRGFSQTTGLVSI